MNSTLKNINVKRKTLFRSIHKKDNIPPEEAGAKADAEATRDARRASFMIKIDIKYNAKVNRKAKDC